MRCPNVRCRSYKIAVQRTDHPHTEGEWPSRFAGLNGIYRRRFCRTCGGKFTTMELIEAELDTIARRGAVQPPAPGPSTV